MLLTFGAIYAGNALGNWGDNQFNARADALEETHRRELEALRRDREIELRANSERAARQSQVIWDASADARRAYDAEVEKARREYNERIGIDQ